MLLFDRPVYCGVDRFGFGAIGIVSLCPLQVLLPVELRHVMLWLGVCRWSPRGRCGIPNVRHLVQVGVLDSSGYGLGFSGEE